MRIDAHHHVWDLNVRDQPWTAELPALRRSFTIDDLRPSLHRNAVVGWVDLAAPCLLGGGYDSTFAAAEAVTARLSGSERDLLFGGVAADVYDLAL